MSVFASDLPEFDAFLSKAKDDKTLAMASGRGLPNTRFIPRNFLNEERLDSARIRSYSDALTTSGPMSFSEWSTRHNRYLLKNIFCSPGAGHDFRFVSRDDPKVCPETFRARLATTSLNKTDFDTFLIRIVPVADIEFLSGERGKDIFSLGEKWAADPTAGNPAAAELSRIFANAYISRHCKHRPAFAAFYEDFLDELRDPANTDWPNRLRDRLGLYHLNQWLAGGLPLPVFLFRYRVKEIPRHPGEADRRPIAIPVVIDSKLFEAFCPAPLELDRGRMLNLEHGADKEPARELLHLFMRMQVEHLFRVGYVTKPVPEDLSSARRDHLLWLELLSGRDGYGSATDADLLR
jgi:hypothetical protein